jgi:hypothetical protein
VTGTATAELELMTKHDVIIFSIAPSKAYRMSMKDRSKLGLIVNGDQRFYSTTRSRGIGAYQIAHHCRENGYSCQVITFVESFTDDELLYLAEAFISDQTVIGISLVFPTGQTKNLLAELIKLLQNRWPNNKYVIGGNSVMDDDIAQGKKFDAYFTGYSEQAFVEWLGQHFKQAPKRLYPSHQGCTVVDGDTSIDKFNIELLNHAWSDDDCLVHGEKIPLEIARGCIFSCKFCSYRNIGKKKFDYIRAPELIRDEMVRNYEQYGITDYTFSDDTFNDSTYKLEKLHKVFTQLPFKLQFWAYLRLDLLHRFPEQIPMLKEMGLRDATFGIESLNYESAKSIGKGLHSDKVKELLHDLYHTHWQNKASISCGIIVGLPYETVKSQLETFKWFQQYPEINMSVHTLALPLSPDGLSAFSRDPESHGYTFDPTVKMQPNNVFFRHGWVNNVGMTESDAQRLTTFATLQKKSLLIGSDQFDFENLTGGRGSLDHKTWDEAVPLISKGFEKFVQEYKTKLFAVADRYRQ